MNILGLDFGTKKIGIALGSTISRTARPLITVEVGPSLEHTLSKLITTWRIKRIVLGHPGDHPNNQVLLAALELFKTTLLDPMQLPIDSWSEQGSTQEAQLLLRDYPSISRDALAAMLILQSYLDQHYT